MFVLPEVQNEFKKFVRAKLYVEEKNQGELQDRLIKEPLLPAYVVVKPGTEQVVGFIGYDVNPSTRVQNFLKFLRESSEAASN